MTGRILQMGSDLTQNRQNSIQIYTPIVNRYDLPIDMQTARNSGRGRHLKLHLRGAIGISLISHDQTSQFQLIIDAEEMSAFLFAQCCVGYLK